MGKTRARARVQVALLSLLSMLAVMCAPSFQYRPPCSAVDPEHCWTIPPHPALHCDAEARVAAALPKLGGFVHEDYCNEGGHMLLGPGTEDATPEEHQAFVDEHMRFAKALDGVRVVGSVCCSPNSLPGGCLVLYVDHCTGPTLDEVAKHATRWAKGVDLQHKRLRVLVQVSAAEGPRCLPTDPKCMPLPYDRAKYGPGAERLPVDQPYEHMDTLARDERVCTHDGDCAPACQSCESWIEARPQLACSQEYRGQLKEALCGCIAGHCNWFTQ